MFLGNEIALVVSLVAQRHVVSQHPSEARWIATAPVDQLLHELGVDRLMTPPPTRRANLDASGEQYRYCRLKTRIVAPVRAVVEATVRQLTLGAFQALGGFCQVVVDGLCVHHMR